MPRARVVAAVVLMLAGLATARAAAAGEPRDRAPARGPNPRIASFRVLPTARADLGWTGISHDQAWPADQVLRFALACEPSGARCTASGGSPGDFFGSPIPLSSGGVPACLVNRLRAPVSGTVEPRTGCGDLEIRLASSVHLGASLARPCPACAGDRRPNDGKKDGHCEGGATPGTPCDAQGVSRVLGTVSSDCLPAETSSVGALAIDLAPLTTRDARLGADAHCATPAGGGASCHCAGQAQASACSSGTCPARGRCDDGPIDGACSAEPFRSCRPGSESADCEAIAPGSGRCVVRARPCFAAAITARGRCDRRHPVYVATFCAPATRATAINSTAGLPGPARLVLPLERLP